VAFLRELGEGPTVVELGFLHGQLLPTLDDDVDVLRIEFDPIADSFRQFRGCERGAATEEWIVNQFTTPEVVQDRAPHEIHGLLCRMIELVLI